MVRKRADSLDLKLCRRSRSDPGRASRRRARTRGSLNVPLRSGWQRRCNDPHDHSCAGADILRDGAGLGRREAAYRRQPTGRRLQPVGPGVRFSRQPRSQPLRPRRAARCWRGRRCLRSWPSSCSHYFWPATSRFAGPSARLDQWRAGGADDCLLEPRRRRLADPGSGARPDRRRPSRSLSRPGRSSSVRSA